MLMPELPMLELPMLEVPMPELLKLLLDEPKLLGT